MAKTTPSTIRLRSRGNDYERDLPLAASVDIRPGDLVTGNSSGQVLPNATAADVDPEVIVAMENDQVGDGITVSYTADNELVRCWWPLPGEECYMWLKTANNAAIGASLESGGAGNLQLLSTGKHIFTAVEAVNNASGSDVRIKVRRV